MDDEKRVEQFYNLAVESAEMDGPKRSLFSLKCPKCAAKLEKKSAEMLIVATEDGTGFSNRVVSDAGLSMGAYNCKVDYFKCACGYEYAKSQITPISD